MSYTPPPGDSLAFVDSGEAYTPPPGNALLLVEGGLDDGTVRIDIAATVDVLAEFVVAHAVTADLSATLDVSASFGITYDWASTLDPVLLREFYRLVIVAPELDDIVLPISSWQATANEGEAASFVQAVIPAALEHLDALLERQEAGELVIYMGYRSEDLEQMEELIRAPFTGFDYSRGARNATATVSGYAYLGVSDASASRTLTGVRTISYTAGRPRVMCNIDMFLRPGMTVHAMGETFSARYISYYVGRSGKHCTVGG